MAINNVVHHHLAPDGASHDALWGGRLPLWQPARGCGYRFNLDSVLLAGFAADATGHGHALELGAGCGMIGFALLAAGKATTLTAVERQPQLAQLLRRNVAHYGWQQRIEVVQSDLRHASLPEADLIVFNPPYFAAHASRPSLEPGRDAGRRECFGTLEDFVVCASARLRGDGEVAAIVPYARRKELVALFARSALRPRRLRAVQAKEMGPPRHLLLAVGRDVAQPQQHAPLVVHRPGGGYTEEVARLIAGPAAWRGPRSGGADLWPSAG